MANCLWGQYGGGDVALRAQYENTDSTTVIYKKIEADAKKGNL